jgi:Right handed beta helix region
MKFPQVALLLFLGASRIVNASVDENTRVDLPTEGRIHRSLQGKKSNPKKGKNGMGGKKDDGNDCNTNAVRLDTSSCPIRIITSGRYVLPDDVQCTGVDGIEITANDVYLDCQDHIITGDGVDNILTNGIFVRDGSSDVTITNCHATKFFFGITGDSVTGNFIISDSSFNENQGAGGSLSLVASSTILSSHFDRNNVIGMEIVEPGTTTIISSTFNGNLGFDSGGLIVSVDNKVSVWDSEFSNNGSYGVFSNSATVSLFKSIVCNNNLQNGLLVDVIDLSIAQAVTCDSSTQTDIGGNPVCQCPCSQTNSGGTSDGGIEVSVEAIGNFTPTPIQWDP